MIDTSKTIVETKHTIEEDGFEIWQGFDKNGNEVEWRTKRTHIKKERDDDGKILKMEINGKMILDNLDATIAFNEPKKSKFN